MPPPTRRLRGLDDQTLQVWKVRPFDELMSAFAAVRQVAVRQRPLGMVTGAAGSGKTFCAQVFQKNERDVVIVTVPPKDILSARLLLDELALGLDMEPQSYRTRADLFFALVDSLISHPRFLIVDEADRLRPSLADLLRELAELSGQPLCYLGCPSLDAIVARVPATHHRIGFRHNVKPVELEDVEAALVGKSLDPDGRRRLDKSTVDAIFECTRGNLRHMESLVHLLRGARNTRTSQPYDITPSTVQILNRRFQKLAA